MLIKESELDYRKNPALNYHKLADFQKSPALYKWNLDNPPEERSTPALLFGRAVHTLVLEPTDFAKQYAIGGPVNEKTGNVYGKDTKAYAEWMSQQGKPCAMSQEEYDKAKAMRDSVFANKVCANLLASGRAELSCHTNAMKFDLKGRFDFLSSEGVLVDLKTCDDLDWFESDARRYRYAHQLAFYRWLHRASEMRNIPVAIIAVEKSEPYRAGFWNIAPGLLSICEEENIDAMKRLRTCQEMNHFPTGYETMRELNTI